MRFDSTPGSIGIVSAIVLALSGCGGSELLPVGGPFGEELNPGAVGDGGTIGDGNGLLPPSLTPIAANGSALGSMPTWTEIYNTYLAEGTIGNCMHCHTGDVGGTASPSALYAWLSLPGPNQQIGNPPVLVNPDLSCINWMSSSGNMPFGPPIVNATATMDFLDWAKAGALNN